jgi:hypothetical protein|tara:strand:+ start:201 stop:842 length:642 start_codon:yes stop_codon:yes gene_type:complete
MAYGWSNTQLKNVAEGRNRRLRSAGISTSNGVRSPHEIAAQEEAFAGAREEQIQSEREDREKGAVSEAKQRQSDALKKSVIQTGMTVASAAIKESAAKGKGDTPDVQLSTAKDAQTIDAPLDVQKAYEGPRPVGVPSQGRGVKLGGTPRGELGAKVSPEQQLQMSKQQAQMETERLKLLKKQARGVKGYGPEGDPELRALYDSNPNPLYNPKR